MVNSHARLNAQLNNPGLDSDKSFLKCYFG